MVKSRKEDSFLFLLRENEMKIIEKLNEDYLNNVDFIYIYKHGAKVIEFDMKLWFFYFNGIYFIKGKQKEVIDF